MSFRHATAFVLGRKLTKHTRHTVCFLQSGRRRRKIEQFVICMLTVRKRACQMTPGAIAWLFLCIFFFRFTKSRLFCVLLVHIGGTVQSQSSGSRPTRLHSDQLQKSARVAGTVVAVIWLFCCYLSAFSASLFSSFSFSCSALFFAFFTIFSPLNFNSKARQCSGRWRRLMSSVFLFLLFLSATATSFAY